MIDGLQKFDLFTIIPSNKSFNMFRIVDLPVPGSPIISSVLQLEQFWRTPTLLYVFLNKYLEHQKNTLARDQVYYRVRLSVLIKFVLFRSVSSLVFAIYADSLAAGEGLGIEGIFVILPKS